MKYFELKNGNFFELISNIYFTFLKPLLWTIRPCYQTKGSRFFMDKVYIDWFINPLTGTIHA